jgi:hypothetical protein
MDHEPGVELGQQQVPAFRLVQRRCPRMLRWASRGGQDDAGGC